MNEIPVLVLVVVEVVVMNYMMMNDDYYLDILTPSVLVVGI